MSLPRVVSRDEWLDARKALLAKEKALTRARDALNTERRELPMVEIDKEYVFEGPDGQGRPARPVRGPPPAHRRALHVRPELGRRLPELHGRRRRGLGRAARAPARARHDARVRVAGAARQDRALQGEAGLDVPLVLVVRQRLQLRLPRHARRVGRAGRVQLPDQGGARAGGRVALRRGRRVRRETRAGATSCASATASSTRTRCTPAGSRRSAARTTCSTRPRSAARRTGRSRRAAPPAPAAPFPTSPPEVGSHTVGPVCEHMFVSG